jgi:hypothetical protein
MKCLALNFSTLAIVFFISNTSIAQINKKSPETKASAVSEIGQEVKVVQQPTNEPSKSPHGHLLMKEIPVQGNTKVSKTKEVKLSTEIIGEGQYLNYNKEIMLRTIDGDIPSTFPKHIKGQSKEQYNQVIMEWARNNKNLIKSEYHHEIK